MNTPTCPRPMLAATLSLALLLGACAPLSPPTAAPTTAPAPAVPPAAAVLPVDAALRTQAQSEVRAYLKTLETLVGIESGSSDLEGLKKLSAVVAERLGKAGMQVELKPARAPEFHPQLKGAELGQMGLLRPSCLRSRCGTSHASFAIVNITPPQ